MLVITTIKIPSEAGYRSCGALGVDTESSGTRFTVVGILFLHCGWEIVLLFVQMEHFMVERGALTDSRTAVVEEGHERVVTVLKMDVAAVFVGCLLELFELVWFYPDRRSVRVGNLVISIGTHSWSDWLLKPAKIVV